MAHTGYIKWEKLRQGSWIDTGGKGTWVYAFWSVDYGRSHRDAGINIIRPYGDLRHPDHFVQADAAQHVLETFVPTPVLMSPNAPIIYDSSGTGRTLLGSLCLGTSSTTYATMDDNRYWWCAGTDLTYTGRKMLRMVSRLYLRAPTIVTYLDPEPISPTVPEADTGTATVGAASGHSYSRPEEPTVQ